MSWFKRKSSSGLNTSQTRKRASYADVPQPPAEDLEPHYYERLSSLWSKYIASSDILTGQNALHATRSFFEYARFFQRVYCDSDKPTVVYSPGHHPPNLCNELGRMLLVVGSALPTALAKCKEDPDRINQPPLEFICTYLELCEFLSGQLEQFPSLCISEVPVRVLSLALGLLQEHQQGKQPALVEFLTKCLGHALSFASKVFAPEVSWIQAPTSGRGEANPIGRQQLDCLESLLDSFAAEDTHESEWFDNTLCLLNGWVRCSGDRVQMLLQHQPLRSRLIHLLRSAKPHVWAIESVVALLASLPSDAAAPGSDGGNYASAVLFGFLGQLSEPLAEGQSVETHAERTVLLLSAFLRSLAASSTVLSQVASQAGIFDALVRLLEQRMPTDDLQNTMQTTIIGALVALLNNSNARAQFQIQIGYQRVLAALFYEGVIERATGNLFLELVVGAKVNLRAFSSQSGYTVTNPDALSAFLRWLPSANNQNNDNMLWLFDCLLGLCGRTYYNLSRCCHGGVLDTVLHLLGQWTEAADVITAKLIDLLEMLGGHSISVDSLRLLLNLLNVENPTFRPKLYLQLQNAMQAMARHSDPVYFFDLHGSQSMLWIPQVSRPSSAGYTMHFWVRLESLTFKPSERRASLIPQVTNTHLPKLVEVGQSEDALEYLPRLYSLYSKNGRGIEAFFSAGRLAVRTSTKAGVETKIFPAIIPRKRWICLTIVHRAPRGPFKSGPGEIRLYVDGNLSGTDTLPLPEGSDPFLDCRIARGRDADERVEVNSHRCGSTSLRAQVATVCMMEPLSHAQVNAIYSLGINYYGVFEPTSFELLGNHTLGQLTADDTNFDAIPARTELLIESTLHSKMYMFISAKLCDGKHVRDQAAYAAFQQEFAKAELTGTFCIHRNIKEAVNSVGGVAIFSFLLHQLDRVMRLDITNLKQEDCLDSFFALLANLLENSVNATQALQTGTLEIVRSLLLGRPHTRFSPNSLQSIQLLLELPSPRAEFVQGVLSNLLFEFRLWTNSSLHVRNAHHKVVLNVIKANPVYCRRVFGVEFILDALRHVDNTESTDPEAGMLDTAGGLIHLLQFYFEQQVRKRDVKAIVQFIMCCSDNLCSVLLCFLLNYLTTYQQSMETYEPGRVLETVLAEDLFLFFTLFERNSETVHQLTLWVLAYYANQSTLISAASKQKVRLCGRGNWRLVDMLARCPFSIDVFAALIALSSLPIATSNTSLVCEGPDEMDFVVFSHADDIEDDGTGEETLEMPVSDTVETTASVMSGAHPRRLMSQVLFDAALQFLHLKRDELALDVLASHTKVILDVLRKPQNAARLLLLPGWDDTLLSWADFDFQESFVEHWPYARELANLPFTTSCLEFGRLWSLGYLFTVLANGCLRSPTAWRALRCTMTKLAVSSSSQLTSYAMQAWLLGNILGFLDQVIMDTASGIPHRRNAAGNAIQLTMLVEEFIFINPTSLQHLPPDLLQCREELCILVLAFSKNHNLLVMSSFAPLSEISGPMTRSPVRRGGMLRIMMRLLLDLLLQSSDDNFPQFFSALDILLANASLAKLLSPNEQLHIIWQLYNALVGLIEKGTASRDRLATVCGLMKRELRTRPYPIPGGRDCLNSVEDSRFHDEARLSSFLELIQSSSWRAIMSDKIGPAAFSVMEVERVDRGEQALAVHDLQEEIESTVAKETAILKSMRKRHNEFFCEAVAIPAESLKIEEAIRCQGWDDKLRAAVNAGKRKWRSLYLFISGARGVIDDSTAPELREMKHWKLDRTENFSRMRLKLEANLHFDQHLAASQARDSGSAAQAMQQQLPTAIPVAADSEDGIALDGDLADESTSEPLFTNDDIERVLFSTEGQAVVFMEATDGRLSITTTHVIFYTEAEDNLDTHVDFKWPIDQLREIHFRRYNLRPTALEFFLIDQTNFFVNFEKGVRENVYKHLLRLQPPSLVSEGHRRPAKMLAHSGLTEKWRRRQISNFDYLMQLNTIAGRTYNDLNQYPVFPWIIADYTSEVLDFDDPRTFRDLRVPIGAMNEDKREQLMQQYEDFEDPTGVTKKFHYGTHYSNAAGVLHFLIRLEPFTSLHIGLQSGKFDHADRQFHSIPTVWQSIMGGSGDVKELIPEFFYMPDFLTNAEHFDLGTLQKDNVRVDDVLLPPWASTPEEFIRMNRKALESDFVSSNLHHWIDLIFGYKQKGEEARKAINVFYYTSYEGAVDLDQVEDPVERRAQEGMIREFGQTPSQLLTTPHPPRLSKAESAKLNVGVNTLSLDRPTVFEACDSLRALFIPVTPGDPVCAIGVAQGHALRSWLKRGLSEHLVTLSASGLFGVHDWSPVPQVGLRRGQPFTLDVDPSIKSQKQRFLLGAIDPRINISTKLVVMSPKAKYTICAGLWDNSIRIAGTRSRKTIFSARAHSDIVTCLSLDISGERLISGCADGTCILWKFSTSTEQKDGAPAASLEPQQILFGHSAEITSVGLVVALDMAVTASRDGTLNIHDLCDGQLVRTLRPELGDIHEEAEDGTPLKVDIGSCQTTINLLGVTQVGTSCCYAQWSGPNLRRRKHSLHVFGCNGKQLARERSAGHITGLTVSRSGDHVVTSSKSGTVVIRSLHNLQVMSVTNVHVPIHSMVVTHSEEHIMVGLRDGKLIILTRPQD